MRADGLTPQDFASLFKLTPAEAADYLARRGKLTPTLSWQDLWQQEHLIQFTVSRLTMLDLLESIRDGIARSVNGDLSRRDWTRDTEALLKRNGWWSANVPDNADTSAVPGGRGTVEVVDPDTGAILETRFDSNRLRLIFDTNTNMAYSAGLWERIQRNKATSPYLRYITKRDERVRLQHQRWDNLTLPVDDPFWDTHYPPNGWCCRCRAMSMSQKEYDRRKAANTIKTEAPPLELQPWKNKQGEVVMVPKGIDPGFAYNVGKARMAKMGELVGQKLASAAPALAQAARDASLTPLGGGHHALDAWDGMGQRPGLFDLPPVPVIDVPDDAFGGAQGKVALAKAADAALRTLQDSPGLANDDTGWLLTINSQARKKMGDNEDQNPEDSKAVSVLGSLARSAVIGERHADTRHENLYVKAIYRLFAAMRIKDALYRVRLTVKDYAMPDKPHKLHALESLEIENAPLGILPPSSPDGAVQEAQPTTGRTLSIEQLMAGAMRDDGSPYKE